MRGLVVRTQAGFYTVKTESGIYTCQLRGRIKKVRLQGDLVAVGDWVQLSPLDNQSGIIEEIEQRKRMFSRAAPKPAKARPSERYTNNEYQQILISNPDQVMLVFSCHDPAPRFGMLDRFLVIAERQHIPAIIIANKIDLIGREDAEKQFLLYERIGYKVLYTSAFSALGLDILKDLMAGRISLFTGPSGVGKSSLLNAIQPGLGLQVRQVSRATRKGTHTTTVREMFPLESGGYVADTPGLKALAFWDIEPEEMDGYFPEMRTIVAKCQFNNCTHVQEPGCAIIEAVQEGRIHQERYQSYLRMRSGEID
jgi:ribosome biogenesis GTPase